jgi:predicted oxidoreductase
MKKGKLAVQTAIEQGYTHFDNADFYGNGKCEELFGEVLQDNPRIRDNIIITSKCGIIRGDKAAKEADPHRYDFSKNHILKSVEASLTRLKIDYLDMLLLHRPDYLGDPEEVAEAFQELKVSGKVLHFGVSNFQPSQLSMLQKYCPFPLLVNQVEINIHNIKSLTDGTLDQCQELKISPQAWCPLGGVVYPAWGNTFSPETEARIKLEFDRQAKKYATENWIIMLAWTLKHPANILPIIGTTTPARIKMAKQALELDYSREDWYSLLEARNGHPAM